MESVERRSGTRITITTRIQRQVTFVKNYFNQAILIQVTVGDSDFFEIQWLNS